MIEIQIAGALDVIECANEGSRPRPTHFNKMREGERSSTQLVGIYLCRDFHLMTFSDSCCRIFTVTNVRTALYSESSRGYDSEDYGLR